MPGKYLTKKIIAKHGTDKIFCINLVGYWRLIYTIIGDETKIIYFRFRICKSQRLQQTI